MRRRSQRGVAIIEFALVLPLLLILTFITTEFGRAMYQYNALTKSVRDATRYLSAQFQAESHVDEARNLAVYGMISGGTQPLVAGLTMDRVSAEWGIAGTAPVINTVTVSITGYQFQSLVTTMFDLNMPAITFPPITATMRRQNI